MESRPGSMILMKAPKIKDKTPANIQITAEQLIRDAQAHTFVEVRAPVREIKDEEELEEYKYRKRKEFEESLRRQKHHINNWIKYALWEEQLQEFRRCRSIFERAIDIDYKNVSLWLKYAEMEMKHKFINHARNVWERACSYLPRVDQFWYKYAYMEEMLGNYVQAREIFEKWMTWKPEENAWLAYLKFEERMGESEKCRQIMYRYLEAYPRIRTYLKVARFEEKHKNKLAAREVYERVLEDLGETGMKEEYFLAFAKFEMRCKEYDRAREIFRYGLENIPKDKALKLYDAYVSFEKQHGTREEIDDLILDKRRIYYKEIIKNNPLNYDAWFDLTNLEVMTKNYDRIRSSYEDAIKNIPPGNEKRFWRRYIYLWINYALFEELDANDMQKAKDIYERVLKLIPHHLFTFTKLWVMYAHFHLRCKNIEAARKTFGNGIGKCPNQKLFKAYIEMEMQLAEIDRCRKIYEKWIEVFPEDPNSWIKYAELEKSLDEMERCRKIYELAIQQPLLNMPETVWKAFIDTEISLEEYENARILYKRLLDKTKHVKVWISYALFEKTYASIENARKTFQEAEEYFKQNSDLKEERVMLLESWKELEESIGDPEMIEKIKNKQPKKVKKQRKIKIQEGENEEDAGWEEYYDYIFPDDESSIKSLKILQKAYKWKEANKP